jgi:hypothetical protein
VVSSVQEHGTASIQSQREIADARVAAAQLA